MKRPLTTSTSCSCGNTTLKVTQSEARTTCAHCGCEIIARPTSGSVVHPQVLASLREDVASALVSGGPLG